MHDFPWPRADGRPLGAKALRVERSVDGDASRVRLSIGHGPTLLLLEPLAPGGVVRLELGEGLEPGDVVQREATLQGRSLQFGAEPARWTAAELLNALGRDDLPRLLVGRLPGEPRPRGREDAPDGDDVEALRALGYME